MLDEERIDELLDEAYSTDDEEEMERLAREVLEMDGENVEALILLADAGEFSDDACLLDNGHERLQPTVHLVFTKHKASRVRQFRQEFGQLFHLRLSTG